MNKKPLLLYKYKPLSSIKDLDRTIDIIANHRIFFPRYDKLNDPLEGSGSNIELTSRWAGISIQIASDRELTPIEEIKKKYRILALSSSPVSPQLWAHYGDNYNGICFCFSTEGAFKNAEPVKYFEPDHVYAAEKDEIIPAVEEGFFHKHKDWNYEKEWRIVHRDGCDNEIVLDEEEFLHFESDELRAIIFGGKVSDRIKQIIVKSSLTKIKFLKAVPGYQTARINLLPWDYEHQYDGRNKPYIEDIEKYIFC